MNAKRDLHCLSPDYYYTYPRIVWRGEVAVVFAVLPAAIVSLFPRGAIERRLLAPSRQRDVKTNQSYREKRDNKRQFTLKIRTYARESRPSNETSAKGKKERKKERQTLIPP